MTISDIKLGKKNSFQKGQVVYRHKLIRGIALFPAQFLNKHRAKGFEQLSGSLPKMKG